MPSTHPPGSNHASTSNVDSDHVHAFDIANIIDVRHGLATDTFNEMERKAHFKKNSAPPSCELAIS